MPSRLYNAPAEEPLTLAEVKAHLRLEHCLDDEYLLTVLTAARAWVEQQTWRGLVLQTWELVLPCFPADQVELPWGNLAGVTSVTYLDADGNGQTLAATVYQEDATNVPGRLRLAYGQSWPSARDTWDAVVVRYVVGWPVADVPRPVKQAILLLTSQLYEHRTPEVTGAALSSVKFAVEALLAPYRLARF